MFYKSFKEDRLSALGFGMMRLPTLPDGQIDEALVSKMVAYAIDHGINYFDTAYPYHGGMSEIVTGHVLSKYPRSSFRLATKYPGHQYANAYNPAEVFEHQLKKCGVEYFDYYLLHNVTESCYDIYTSERWGILDYFVSQKEAGRIRHLGFSSHAEFETLRSFLDYAGDRVEFCQIQLNYLDWTLQKAKARYDLLTERGIPVWVMEPVRGGRLAQLNESQHQRLNALRPNVTDASFAFRWLQQLPNVTMILSGMSDMNQMIDNIETFSTHQPLTDAEQKMLSDIVDELQSLIPCTGCRYCCDGCPQGLDIPMLLNSLNDARFGTNFTVAMRLESLPEEKQPTACIGCGACAAACPQGIAIPQLMAEFKERMAKLPSWKKICAERAAAAARLGS